MLPHLDEQKAHANKNIKIYIYVSQNAIHAVHMYKCDEMWVDSSARKGLAQITRNIVGDEIK